MRYEFGHCLYRIYRGLYSKCLARGDVMVYFVWYFGWCCSQCDAQKPALLTCLLDITLSRSTSRLLWIGSPLDSKRIFKRKKETVRIQFLDLVDCTLQTSADITVILTFLKSMESRTTPAPPNPKRRGFWLPFRGSPNRVEFLDQHSQYIL